MDQLLMLLLALFILSLPPARLANGYLPENAELFDVSALLHTVYFGYFETPEKRVMLAFFRDGTMDRKRPSACTESKEATWCGGV